MSLENVLTTTSGKMFNVLLLVFPLSRYPMLCTVNNHSEQKASECELNCKNS